MAHGIQSVPFDESRIPTYQFEEDNLHNRLEMMSRISATKDSPKDERGESVERGSSAGDYPSPPIVISRTVATQCMSPRTPSASTQAWEEGHQEVQQVTSPQPVPQVVSTPMQVHLGLPHR